MKVFISWSGPRSRAIAEALNDWLRRIIQAVKPFYSPEIEKGAKWSSEVDDALEGTRFGIICLTPDNIKSPWIHYEAGALSKTKDALIWTFLSGLTPGDVPPPLGKFQHTMAQKEDVLQLLKTINRRLADVGGEPLQERLLEEDFELFWPKLEEKLKRAESLAPATPAQEQQGSKKKSRDERAILDEILELVRSQERRMLSFEDRLSVIQTATSDIEIQPTPKRNLNRKSEFTVDINLNDLTENNVKPFQLLDLLSNEFPEANIQVHSLPEGEFLRVAISFSNRVDWDSFREKLSSLLLSKSLRFWKLIAR